MTVPNRHEALYLGGAAALFAAALLPDLNLLGAAGARVGLGLYGALGAAAWVLPLWLADEARCASGRPATAWRRVQWAGGAVLAVVGLGLCGLAGQLGDRVADVVFGAIGFAAHLAVLLGAIWFARRALGPQRVEHIATRAAAMQRRAVVAWDRAGAELERGRIARAVVATADESDDFIDLDLMVGSRAHPVPPLPRRCVVQPVIELDAEDSPPPTDAPHRPVIWRLPSVRLLAEPAARSAADEKDELRATARLIEARLYTHSVSATYRGGQRGPVVDTLKFAPLPGQPLSALKKLAPELALHHEGARLVIQGGTGHVAVEIPRPASDRAPIALREVLDTTAWRQTSAALPLALGLEPTGEPVIADLAACPHLLIAGATGAGKSVGLNVMLTSLLLSRSPRELRLGLIDPKVVELARYRDIPHLLAPPATETEDAIALLTWACREMDRRYQLFGARGATDLDRFNALGGVETLPRVVIVVDEYADLTSVAKGDVEGPVTRLAQKARAAGMHVILATQRPSVDVVTGKIKTNFPARIAYKVATKIDSQVILDRPGAEALLGKGDSLCLLPALSTDLHRVHSAHVCADDVQIACDAWRAQGSPEYVDLEANQPARLPTHPPTRSLGAETPLNSLETAGQAGRQAGGQAGGSSDDELYDRACDVCADAGYASAAALRRELGIGYSAAKRLLDRMDADALLGDADARGARKWAGPQ